MRNFNSRPTCTFERLEPRYALTADFNGDLTVDSLDLEIWQGNYGTVNTATQQQGDSDGDMDVDGRDFLAWQRQFGQSTAPLVAPRGGDARPLSLTSIEVTWEPSVSATSYVVIRRQPDTETAYTIIAPDVIGTSFTDTGLSPGTLYEYRVAAKRNPQSEFSSPFQSPTASNLTAFRPQGVQDFQNPSGGPIYKNPFPKWEVPEEYEVDSALGPGIRINTDDDNQNGVVDRAEAGSAVPQENDLIEVKIDRLPGAGTLTINAGGRLWLYRNHDRTGRILSGDPVTFVNDRATIFVEWIDTVHGTDLVTLVDQSTQTTLDTLRFHSFRSMVVVFGGNTQNPMDTDGDGSIGDPVAGGPEGNREGMFDTATELYVTGWDVYAYDEEVNLEIPYEEVINAVDRRLVEPDLNNFQGGGIGIMGYSQGGGAAHDLIEMLSQRDPEGDFITMFACYVDAVERQIFPLNDPITQTDWPDLTYWMLNIFQRSALPIDNFVGDYIDEDDNTFGGFVEEHNVSVDSEWDNTLIHTRIDDDIQVRQTIRIRLQDILIRR